MPDTALSLIGFMDEQQAHTYLLKTCALRPDQQTSAMLTATWQAAHARLATPIVNAGFPDIQPIPLVHKDYLERVIAHPRFINPIDGMDVDFALVEIEPLLAYQQHIWVEHSYEMCRDLPDNPSTEQVLRVCLPEQIQPIGSDVEVRHGPQPGQVAIVVIDLDIEAQSLAIYPTPDPSAHFVGWLHRRRLPYVQVARFNGKCYLRNGFHRVYGLVAKGVTHVPCIFLEAPTPGQAGIRPGRSFDLALLESDNPPTVAHLTRGHAVRLPLQRLEGVIQLTVQTGTQPAP